MGMNLLLFIVRIPQNTLIEQSSRVDMHVNVLILTNSIQLGYSIFSKLFYWRYYSTPLKAAFLRLFQVPSSPPLKYCIKNL